MSVDRKNRGKTYKKRKFHGNRFTKQREMDVDDCLQASTSDAGASIPASETVDTDITPAVKRKATPTRSEMKLKDLYSFIDDSNSDSEDVSSDHGGDSDSGDEVLDENLELEGNRIIDVGILNANIASQLACQFCHSAVQLCEVKRQGLASEFAFHCSKKNL